MTKNFLNKIFLPGSMGFCAGVRRALLKITRTCKTEQISTVYLTHPVIHNEDVSKEISDLGVKTFDNVSNIPEHATWIISAHGVTPNQRIAANNKNLNIVDATCPLVSKTHLQIARLAKEGYELIILGDATHVEIIGLLGQAMAHKIPVTIIYSETEAQKFRKISLRPLAFVTQTTFSEEKFSLIYGILVKNFPHIVGPKKGDICYATIYRQRALIKLINRVEAVVILGSTTSSNANKLLQIAQKRVPACLIRGIKYLNPVFLKNISSLGITAAASTPDCVIEECLKKLQQWSNETVEVIKDPEEYPEPFLFDFDTAEESIN